ncbi:DEAD/DEAH box helicase family protein [Priestia aryabhattai]|uniref:DEAD/DEAH box helicase family protein n=1 Tax=Priestia aryabhattai TaxID=412384 RepID=UPI00245365B5|nr:DEAD/DEAH box helicase family protein [Priestia aryabhattai]MDH3111462.1 DEAD/DEAH box helicase family protein [Priestia aryabhattai]MDH3129617.1 DEAD/DEAH box helicase family protein [Priestia aryabhattai]
MLTNFEFLQDKSQFQSFANACLEAEKSLQISPATCVILTRRALELSVKWLYASDSELKVPYQDNLSSLIHERTFIGIIDEDLFPLIKYIIKLGNVAVHTNSNITRDEAVLALHNLHQFIDWLDYCYSEHYSESEFKEEVLLTGEEPRRRPEEYKELYEKMSSKDRKLEVLMKENAKLRKNLTKKRIENTNQYDFQVDELSEFDTRKIYIDLELKLAGWGFGRDIIEEYQVAGMPNSQGIGFIDYVLLGDNGKPIAVVEAKRTSYEANKGKQQAKLYADCIEQMHGQRPIIFYTNGFDIRIWDDTNYPERKVSGFYTKADLQLLIDRRTIQRPLTNIEIKDEISNRYYQKEAIFSVCEAIQAKQRKSLLVMATGSGKTRTAISLVDVLVRHNWVKNVLFLADRKTLVSQAKKNFNNLLPSMTLCNLLDNKDNPELSRMVFSTYPTMMNAIDDTKRKDGNKLFTVGHFDLIIVDESHRSIYKKYRAIFEYFDGITLGLTATPKDEIDKNTYDIFGLETGAPTYAYELKQAVKDGYLVEYRTIESTSKILDDGIRYDELSDEEREQYEDTFTEEQGQDISNSAVNQWLFNDSTIDQVLNDLMEKGIKVEGGDKLGKTIIFANNSTHAKRIVERFDYIYPHYSGKFAKQIDYKVDYVETSIEEFSTKEKLPQIAVSVDMLDTGVDIPEVVNLVFFKKVRSKSKFWQMIGRGTRLCPNLFGIDQDKEHFLIFDYLRNFDFFRENQKGIEGKVSVGLTERIFNMKVDIIKELQALVFQEEAYINHRKELVEDVYQEISRLNDENFQVRMHLQFVHKYKNRSNWQALSVTNVSEVQEHISPLILPIIDDELAKRFDNIMYSIELATLTAKSAGKSIKSVIQTAEELAKLSTIPQINAKRDILIRVQSEEFWEEANIFELEEVREAIRELVKFLEKEKQKDYYTNFSDMFTLINKDEEAFYGSNDLQNYRKKVSRYLKDHQDQTAIYKLRHNKPLTKQDVETLEKILWIELGTEDDYKKEFGDTPITKLVRQIVGLDQQAANEAFSEFLNEEKLNVNQIKFVKLIIDYVVKNGTLEKKVLQEDPFRSLGSVTELFRDNIDDVRGIIGVIDSINRNTEEFEGA